MITLFLINILLAVLWCFTWGVFDFYTFATGFFLSYLLVSLCSRSLALEGYGRKASQLLRFLLYFGRILIVANVQIAIEIFTPRHQVQPRIVRFDVEGMTPGQQAALVSLINLTPGSLVIDISRDRRTFYVHCVYAKDRDAAIAQLKYLRDRLLTEVF